MSKSWSVLRREAAQRGNSPPEWTKGILADAVANDPLTNDPLNATSGAWLELLAAAVDVGSRPRRAIVSRRQSANRFADSYADPLAWRGTPPYT